MKPKLTPVCLVILLAIGNNSFAQNSKTKVKINELSTQGDMSAVKQNGGSSAKGNDVTSGYRVGYSSKFKTTGVKYSPIVLRAWKKYDNNSFEGMSGILADSVVAILPDGTVIQGKENFVNALKAYRGGFASVESQVTAYMDFASIDKNEDWVGIWGGETDTKSDGSKNKVILHELWRFDKQGKVSLMRQFIEQEPRFNQ